MENCEKKRLSGQRPKKRRFQGNKFLKKTISGESKKKKTNFVRKAPNDSASYRKLPSEKYLLDSCEPNISQHFKGYRLIDISLFSAIRKICLLFGMPWQNKNKREI
ncbi:hypothetical protein TNIN_305991 [Trichonephila inaurata madagascariensis]|uniref:Uncharacterized protein n=1 Tax=Trichonephila inaurata madagascariensis TaxID=2747483 RepID=A0A8X7CJ05_9ARAC|nr:hypothetical protein TNIN_305991 [Trichonephila inaurata madagascariensis]